MPIPNPRPNEEQGKFVSRCISALAEEGDRYTNQERIAICYDQWRKSKQKEEKKMSLTHNSKVADSEPSWANVDKTKLPRKAFADMGEPDKKSTWRYPHHWVKNGSGLDENGVYTTGEMYLHTGGLRAARQAAGGARSGQEASSGIKAHLNTHPESPGTEKDDTGPVVSQTGTTSVLAGHYDEIPDLPDGYEKPRSYLEQLEEELKIP